MNIKNIPTPANGYLQNYAHAIIQSIKNLAGIEIVDLSLSIEEQAEQAFNADYVLLSHDTSTDPLFDYANKTAMDLFERTAEELIGMPSRFSAEADERARREQFLHEVEKNGYAGNYSGIRISKTGRRFEIKDVLLWNVYDDRGKLIGQAAKIDEYRYV
ncbi:MAG: MEKHLA domain-containing protein [Bacteroidales bacterium]|nr:MEKHLA domain-containing protein [Bacteroidales bacterium]